MLSVRRMAKEIRGCPHWLPVSQVLPGALGAPFSQVPSGSGDAWAVTSDAFNLTMALLRAAGSAARRWSHERPAGIGDRADGY